MFLNVTTSTHSLTKVFLSYNRHVSILFNTSIGLKQGDMFSPLFFQLMYKWSTCIITDTKCTIWRKCNSKTIGRKNNLFTFCGWFDSIFSHLTWFKEKICILVKYCRNSCLEVNLKKIWFENLICLIWSYLISKGVLSKYIRYIIRRKKLKLQTNIPI